jgi:hypothetical protein
MQISVLNTKQPYKQMYVASYSLVDRYQYLGGICYFHFQGSFIFYILKVEVADSSEKFVSIYLYTVILKKTVNLIFVFVRSSHLIYLIYIFSVSEHLTNCKQKIFHNYFLPNFSPANSRIESPINVQ